MAVWTPKAPKKLETFEELRSWLEHDRGLDSDAARDSFFNPKPLLGVPAEVGLADDKVSSLVTQLLSVRDSNQTVVVFGDYDADGVCATAILWEALFKAGFKAVPFIPHRERHGYGLTHAACQEMVTLHHPDVVVTVDTGIVAHEAVEALQTQGITVFITDHHEPESTLPPAKAIVHSTQVCATTIAWVVARAVWEACKLEEADTWRELVTIATLADQMPMIGSNRSLVWHGLKQLGETSRPGLRALLSRVQRNATDAITAETITFGLAPRINVAGRLAEPLLALRLLCTRQVSRAQALADELEQLHMVRQEKSRAMWEFGVEAAETQIDDQVIINFHEAYHEGLLGLLASRLVETYHRPAIVLARSGSFLKASARSIAGIHITEVLRQTPVTFESLGGHAMAAGFSIAESNLEALTLELKRIMLHSIPDEQVRPADAIISGRLLDLDTADYLQTWSPFGNQNPQPIFVLDDVKVRDVVTMGANSNHLRFQLIVGQQKIPAIWWGAAARQSELAQATHLVGTISVSVWKGRRVQFQVSDCW